MSNYITEKLNPANLESIEKFFFALFLLSIPLQIRLTFVTPQTYLNGQFNEHATFFIYLSDIFLIITFFIFFVNPIRSLKLLSLLNNIIRHKPLSLENLEKYKNQTWTSNSISILTKISNFSIKNNSFYSSPHLIPMVFITLLILWSLASSLWSEYKNIAVYQTLKLLELGILTFYVSGRLHWFGLKKTFTLIFITGTFQGIIGIGQYLSQKSLGLMILGESIIGSNIDNVAKIVVDGEKMIRAYGTFPHPNVFGGFLILSISCGFWLLLSTKIKENNQNVSSVCAFIKKLFHVKQFDFYTLNKRNIDPDNASADMRETILLSIITIGIILQLTTFILTFSRIAWLGLSAVFLVFLLYVFKLFHVKQLQNNALNKAKKCFMVVIIAAFFALFGLFWNQISARSFDINNKYQQSVNYRILYTDIAIKMIKDHPLSGIGSGNFTLKMKNYSPVPLEWWQYQPAHNIYLLITSELGIIGLVLFLLFAFFMLKIAYLEQNNKIVSRLPTEAIRAENMAYSKQNSQIVSRETILLNNLILAILVSFLFIGLFDHYFWTLQQGRLIFWLMLGLLLSTTKK